MNDATARRQNSFLSCKGIGPTQSDDRSGDHDGDCDLGVTRGLVAGP